jgi:hypothetical protein
MHAMRRYSSLANYETDDRRSILARARDSQLATIAPRYPAPSMRCSGTQAPTHVVGVYRTAAPTTRYH